MSRFARFLVVGGAGFLVDAAALALLLQATPLGPIPARVLSTMLALLATWMLNRRFAFGPSTRGLAREGARYGSVGVASSLVNFGAYAAVLAALPATPPLLALVVGSATALVFSFLGYSRFVFDR